MVSTVDDWRGGPNGPSHDSWSIWRGRPAGGGAAVLADPQGDCLFRRPSVIESIRERAGIHNAAFISRPRMKMLGFTKARDIATPGRIRRLFSHWNPSAILWGIGAVNVHTLDRQVRSIAMTHGPRLELHEGWPFVGDANSSPTVPGVSLVMRVFTAGLHARPADIQAISASSVRRLRLTDRFTLLASTRCRASTQEVLSLYLAFSPAVATNNANRPVRPVRIRQGLLSAYSQTAESVAQMRTASRALLSLQVANPARPTTSRLFADALAAINARIEGWSGIFGMHLGLSPIRHFRVPCRGLLAQCLGFSRVSIIPAQTDSMGFSGLQ